jgi:hypothetical protein
VDDENKTGGKVYESYFHKINKIGFWGYRRVTKMKIKKVRFFKNLHWLCYPQNDVM